MSAVAGPGQAHALTLAVADFLYHEAQLIDERRLDEWLELWNDDALYWIPQGDEPDPVHRVSIAYDDHRRLVERVMRLNSGFAYSQDPPSRTCHVIGNVRVSGEDEAGVDVTSSLIVAEMRRATQNIYAGRVEHRLSTDDGSFRISSKVVRLVNSDVPLGNVTFLI
jgi:3-phenylpropionate/cinnamic acid dioxygenase small subunit